MSEHDEQVALFTWAGLVSKKYPELKMLFAIPNGSLRHIAVARKLKSEGVKSGIPDIFFAVARGEFHGMFIEMKYGKNKTTTQQNEWIETLTEQGYLCIVCYSWTDAQWAIEQYLAIPKP